VSSHYKGSCDLRWGVAGNPVHMGERLWLGGWGGVGAITSLGSMGTNSPGGTDKKDKTHERKDSVEKGDLIDFCWGEKGTMPKGKKTAH